MSGTLINLIIQLVAGAIGGNAAGNALKDYDLGMLGNSISGAIGGVAGGTVSQSLIPMLAGGAGSRYRRLARASRGWRRRRRNPYVHRRLDQEHDGWSAGAVRQQFD